MGNLIQSGDLPAMKSHDFAMIQSQLAHAFLLVGESFHFLTAVNTSQM